MEKEKEFYERLESKGVSRRAFMKYCTFLTASMGLSASFVPKVAEVFAAPAQRPPVVWLHFGECTGCSEAILRSMYPFIDELVLEILSVEYHETIMAAAGHQAEVLSDDSRLVVVAVPKLGRSGVPSTVVKFDLMPLAGGLRPHVPISPPRTGGDHHHPSRRGAVALCIRGNAATWQTRITAIQRIVDRAGLGAGD